MPQQLIYTSAPRGVDVGRSGYCTVARSSTMGESLVQRLEQFSYYERLSEHGGNAERTVFIFRNIDIRGKACHVLSRIKDAPADYTGRTNFIAHHLVFTPDEVANMPTPAVLLNHWSGWENQWEKEPTLFVNESWAELEELKKLRDEEVQSKLAEKEARDAEARAKAEAEMDVRDLLKQKDLRFLFRFLRHCLLIKYLPLTNMVCHIFRK